MLKPRCNRHLLHLMIGENMKTVPAGEDTQTLSDRRQKIVGGGALTSCEGGKAKRGYNKKSGWSVHGSAWKSFSGISM